MSKKQTKPVPTAALVKRSGPDFLPAMKGELDTTVRLQDVVQIKAAQKEQELVNRRNALQRSSDRLTKDIAECTKRSQACINAKAHEALDVVADQLRRSLELVFDVEIARKMVDVGSRSTHENVNGKVVYHHSAVLIFNACNRSESYRDSVNNSIELNEIDLEACGYTKSEAEKEELQASLASVQEELCVVRKELAEFDRTVRALNAEVNLCILNSSEKGRAILQEVGIAPQA